MRRIRIGTGFCAIAGLAFAGTTTTTWISTLTASPTGVFAGSVTLTHAGTAGAFTTTSSVSPMSDRIVIPYRITFSSGTVDGKISFPLAALSASGPATGSATITAGTGLYSGIAGNFPILTIAVGGSLLNGLTITATGSGTVTSPEFPPLSILQVVDAGSYTRGVAAGSVFVVKGAGLSPSGVFQAGLPLSASFHGVSIAFQALGGVASTSAYILNLYNQGNVNQIAAVAPSSLVPGLYVMTVTNAANTVSTTASIDVTVVKTKPGLITQDSTGNGLAVVQNYVWSTQLDVNRFTTGSVNGVTISPAHPGQTLVAWATGLGPISAPDNEAAPFDDSLTSSVSVWLGGVKIPSSAVVFGGRAPGLVGVDQINFVLPANLQTGCTVPFQIAVGETLSQPAFISIAPNATSDICLQDGLGREQLTAFDNGASVRVGEFFLEEMSGALPPASPSVGYFFGSFKQVTGFELPALPQAYTGALHPQGCVVTPYTPANTTPGQDERSFGEVTAIGVATGLDAGALMLYGPEESGASNLLLREDPTSKLYFGSFSSVPTGTYTLTGTGGVDVAAFSASETPGPMFRIAGGLNNKVNRSAGLTLSWTGGSSDDQVEIDSRVYVYDSHGVANGADVSCYTTVGTGGFTIPPSILMQLPVIPQAQLSSGAWESELYVTVRSVRNVMSAPLTAGPSVPTFYGLKIVSFAGSFIYQ